ncbi:MAG: hypothetical protein ACSLEN_07020 [Candidatus Malihini olakiniferum]
MTVLARHYQLPVELALLGGAVLAGGIVLLAALPLMKISGHTAALGTLAIGKIVFPVFMTWLPVTHGPMGYLAFLLRVQSYWVIYF